MIYFLYYGLSIICIFLYFFLRKKTLHDFSIHKGLNSVRVIAIISFYCMGTFSLYLMSLAKEDNFHNWSIFISALILLLIYFYFIFTLEAPKKFRN